MKVPAARRDDYAFPLRIDPAARQVARADYPRHVAEMIRQFLLTTPGERVCRPDFGGGVQRIVFAPNTTGLRSTTELLVRQGLEKYLAGHIEVLRVAFEDVADVEDGVFQITLEYRLLETRTDELVVVQFP
jgi:phage baseplate assembly protein W